MKQSGHLNRSEKTGTGCPVTSNYGRTPLNKHGGVGRQQQQQGRENDVTAIQLHDEIVDIVMLIQAGENTVPSDPKEVLEALVKFGKNIFPTVCIAYRLLRTIAFRLHAVRGHFLSLI